MRFKTNKVSSQNSEERIKKLEELARPLIEYINVEYNPMYKILITCDHVELVGGEVGIPITDYIQD